MHGALDLSVMLANWLMVFALLLRLDVSCWSNNQISAWASKFTEVKDQDLEVLDLGGITGATLLTLTKEVLLRSGIGVFAAARLALEIEEIRKRPGARVAEAAAPSLLTNQPCRDVAGSHSGYGQDACAAAGLARRPALRAPDEAGLALAGEEGLPVHLSAAAGRRGAGAQGVQEGGVRSVPLQQAASRDPQRGARLGGGPSGARGPVAFRPARRGQVCAGSAAGQLNEHVLVYIVRACFRLSQGR